MTSRLEHLEGYNYGKDDPFYGEDLKEELERIYHPKNVEDISNMDNSLSFEYLIALDNKGYLADSIEIEKGIYIETMDRAIEKRDLHFLYVQISRAKPFIARSVWKYLKPGEDLEVYEKPITKDHEKAFKDLDRFIKKHKLILVFNEDLKLKTMENGKGISFNNKYFDEYEGV